MQDHSPENRIEIDSEAAQQDQTAQQAQTDQAASSRRAFLTQGLAAGAGLTLLGGLAHAQSEPAATSPATPTPGMTPAAAMTSALYPGAVDESGEYVLPPLPYTYEALEPHIDAETMKLHHDKHHAAYVKGLKAAEATIAEARKSGNFEKLEGATQKAAFHGAGHFLHCIFWACMSPNPGKPSDAFARALSRDFESQESFEKQFSAAAESVEGSGWAILAWSIPAKKLVILQARNHQNSSQWAAAPLLVLDMWEHAYYKKYSNVRADYIAAFLKVVNWESVGARYEALRSLAG